MRSRSTAALAALMCVAAIGCDSSGTGPAGTVPSLPASTTSSASAAPSTTKTDQQADYSRLLLQPGDLSDDEDMFTEQSSTPSGPDGLPGASALFVNQDDTRAISDTIVIYADAETAADTLKAALPTIGSTITGATTRPAPVGSNGTMAVGTSADGSKATTLLLFNEGPALVRLEFQSAPGDVTTDQFVLNIGKMQQIALRTGLAPAG
ncbi:hypothetical protein [Mycobacterium sp. 29Ha]|uniref:hypothetical protein n=1 Tax=Mycobacterium sp. 29Ha TaxID=2939268 RepID=UPI0029391F9D|nr:hypothetical protein [Mycobacterium sp. 29Ha]MDV3132692.1 hypothetical protein [Mycobacterium sp. 29Ha]